MSDAVNVSQSEFGRQVGKSNVWIHTLVKQGKLPTNPDGTLPLAEALEAYKNLQLRKKENRERPKVVPNTEEAVNVGMSYNKAKAAKETYTAQLRKLELEQKRGELVEKAEVEAIAADIASTVRSKLLSVGVRVAGMCEGRTAREIQEIIEDEINEAMSELRRDWTKS